MKYDKKIPQIKNVGLSKSHSFDKHKFNEWGLQKAYDRKNKVFFDNDSGTLFVAGTSDLHDAWDDLKIPLGLTKHSRRYKQADEELKKHGDNVKDVVGHSLGGAVALELNKNKGNLNTTTYGAPVFSTKGGERYRNYGDPVSIFDRGAHSDLKLTINPHTYHDY